MTGRDPWDQVVIPQCPEACCFRETCPSDRQAGVAALFRAQRLAAPADCWAFAHLAELHKATTGYDAPGSVAEFKQQLAERKAIASEGR